MTDHHQPDGTKLDRTSTSPFERCWAGAAHPNYQANDFEITAEHCVIFLRLKGGEAVPCLVDADDLERVIAFPASWHLVRPNGRRYVFSNGPRGDPSRRRTYLHRFLTGAGRGVLVDHRNHDTLDNRRQNLRVADKSVNGLNRQGATKASKSGIRGVFWDRRRRKWQAKINVGKRQIAVGHFTDKHEAGRAVAAKVAELLEDSHAG